MRPARRPTLASSATTTILRAPSHPLKRARQQSLIDESHQLSAITVDPTAVIRLIARARSRALNLRARLERAPNARAAASRPRISNYDPGVAASGAQEARDS